MNQMHAESLDNRLLGVNYDLGVIYQAFARDPIFSDLETKIPPNEVIGFFKSYATKLARGKLGLPTEQPSSEEEDQYQTYHRLVSVLENQLLYTHFYPVVRKQDRINTDSEKLQHFKEDFDELGQSIDVICAMTGAFIDSVITSEYLRGLGKDINHVLLYYSSKALESEVQGFDFEKAGMRREVPALIVEDTIQSGTTIEKISDYLARQGYGQIFVFSPQTHKVHDGNLEIIKSEPSLEIIKDLSHYVAAQLLRFNPTPT